MVQGRYGVENNDSSRQMRALSGPCPPDKETLNEVLEWHWWHGGCGGVLVSSWAPRPPLRPGERRSVPWAQGKGPRGG